MNFDLIFSLHSIRDNITDEEASSSEISKFHGYNGRRKTDNSQPSWDTNWHSLFKLMNQIASRRTEEEVKLEAVSIMNIIVMRTNAYTVRES